MMQIYFYLISKDIINNIHIYWRLGWKLHKAEIFIWRRHIYCWWLFDQKGSKYCKTNGKMCSQQRGQSWTINLIFSHFMSVSWLGSEIFSQSSYKYFIFSYIILWILLLPLIKIILISKSRVYIRNTQILYIVWAYTNKLKKWYIWPTHRWELSRYFVFVLEWKQLLELRVPLSMRAGERCTNGLNFIWTTLLRLYIYIYIYMCVCVCVCVCVCIKMYICIYMYVCEYTYIYIYIYIYMCVCVLCMRMRVCMCTVTNHPSRTPSKLDELDMQGIARRARVNSHVMFSYGPLITDAQV